MPFDGTGNFIPLGLPNFPAIGGQPIYADQFNSVINDLIAGFASVVARDGQSSMTGNQSYGGFKITSLGAATAAGQALAYDQSGARLVDLQLTGALALSPTSLLRLQINPFQVNETGIRGIDDTLFTYDTDKKIAQFSLTWKNLSWAPIAPVGILSAYGGLSFFTGGLERHRIGTDGLQLFNPAGFASYPAQKAFNFSGGIFVKDDSELLKVAHDAGYISFWNTAGTLRTGYLQMTAGGDAIWMAANNTRLLLAVANNVGFTMAPSGAVTIPNLVASLPWTSISGRPTALSQFSNDIASSTVSTFNGRNGAVNLNSSDVTVALGFLPVSSVSGAMIIAALGFTPYNSSNPSGYISGITSAMVVGALGFLPGYYRSVASIEHNSGTDYGLGRVLYDTTLATSSEQIQLHKYFVYALPTSVGGGTGGP